MSSQPDPTRRDQSRTDGANNDFGGSESVLQAPLKEVSPSR